MQLFLDKWDEVIIEEFVGRSIPTGFSGTVIQMLDGLLHLVPGDRPKIRALREKLSKESVGVFIAASLPGGIGMGKIGRRLQGAGNSFMLHKF